MAVLDDKQAAAEAAPVEAPGGSSAAPAGLELLRRFHFGDPEARPDGPPPDLLPVALHPFRGAPVRTGWPLLVDRRTNQEPWARSLAALLRADPGLRETRALADNLGRLERCVAEGIGAAEAPAQEAVAAAAQRMAAEIALPQEETSAALAAVAAMTKQWPEQAVLLPFGTRAAQRLMDLAAKRRLAAARRAILGPVQELAEALGALLEADRERRPAGILAEERVESMGALATRFVDPGQLAGVVAKRNAGASFPAARRARIEAAR